MHKSKRRGYRIGRKGNPGWKIFVRAHTAYEATSSSYQAYDTRYDSDSFRIAVDNCATRSFTNSLDDYVEPPTKCNGMVHGIGQATIKLKGTVKWTIQDDIGRRHDFVIPDVYYQPSLPWRLLCPQQLAQIRKDIEGTGCTTLGDRIELFWDNRKYKRTIPIDPNTTNVGIMWSAPGIQKFMAYVSQISSTNNLSSASVDSKDDTFSLSSSDSSGAAFPEIPINKCNNQSDTKDGLREDPVYFDFGDASLQEKPPPDKIDLRQRELQQIHERLGHAPMHRLRAMAKHGILPKYLAEVPVPICASCQYGKQTRTPWRSRSPAGSTSRLVKITQPGDCVSIDQLESPTPGFIGQIKGILTTKRYQAATVFVDHFSRLGYVYLQTSTNAEETLQAKQSFEAYCRSFGVTIRHYHADNGRFSETKFVADMESKQQTMTLCGVGAHFQNGIAEKRIRDLQENARTMMLHATARWPQAHSTSLWPYAVRYANDVLNSTPRHDTTNRSPLELFSPTYTRPKLKHFHTFGCPTYVLNAPLQNAGRQIGKWMSRARLGIYLGMSPKHARSVALILNPRTGHVSPQYHIKFDDDFKTIATDTRDPTHGIWRRLTGLLKVQTNDNVKTRQQQVRGPQNNQPLRENTREKEVNRGGVDIAQTEGEQTVFETHLDNEAADLPTADEEEINLQNQSIGTPVAEENPTTAELVPRRSRRAWKPTRKFLESVSQETIALPVTLEVAREVPSFEQEISDEMQDPIAFAATKSDPDTMYYHQAMKAPDAKHFRQAMQKEIDAHDEKQHWELFPRKDLPKGIKPLASVWSMKRKRRIKTREVYKWKARLNVHGGQQKYGENYWETFAPVVTWLSIRLVLILSIIFGWHTRQVDFVLAYPQAPVETELFMEIPQGVELKGATKKDYVLRLKRNLYGQKQAGRVWNKFLHDGLIKAGFKQSKIDECVYYRGKTLFLVYVDDGILAGPSETDIDVIIAELKKKFDMTDEGTLTDYLGVNVQHLPDDRIKLSQPHLIDQIIKDLNFKTGKYRTKVRDTPALSTKILSRDEEGEPHKATWNYRSVIGKLNFLEKSTRGELGYAVHQAARFCENPKTSHTEAVHNIGRYLLGTRDEGIILDPNNEAFECFADADFCGLWDKETADTDPSTAKSRSGYLIRFAGCPLLWASKLQTEMALSTTEAEYISLSTALREVIAIMQLFEEMREHDIIQKKYVPKVYCKAFEDNSGAVEMAKEPRMRPRTKHINVKYHHFRSYVESGKIEIHQISTEDQLADLWTKPLNRDLFKKFVQQVFGWNVDESIAKQQELYMKRGSVGLHDSES